MYSRVRALELGNIRQFIASFGGGSFGHYLEFYTNKRIGVFNAYSGPECTTQ